MEVAHSYYNIYKMKSLMSCDYDVTIIAVVQKDIYYCLCLLKQGGNDKKLDSLLLCQLIMVHVYPANLFAVVLSFLRKNAILACNIPLALIAYFQR